jgi:transposase
MSGVSLSQEQWDKILEFLRRQPGVYVGVEQQCRRFVEGVLWMLRSGAQWRLLPEGYGHWNSVFKRFDRWSEKGVWEAMHRFFVDDPDMESVLIDSTIVRAHPCAAGARKSEEDPALGRSRGGFSTKIHVKVDALGNPLEFLLSAGQVSDVSQAPALLDIIGNQFFSLFQ